MQARVVWLEPAAPAKPAYGAPCNGCGVCCAAEPCPIGMLLSRRRQGSCASLRWNVAERRYRCGAVAASPRWARGFVLRRIGAAAGCDSDLEPRAAVG